MPSAIVRGATGQPGAVGYASGITTGIFNELNFVIPDYIPGLMNKYGNDSYMFVADILGNSIVEKASTSTNTYSHFEKGRIFGSFLVNANVTGVAANTAITVTLKSPESYQNAAGSQAAILLNQVVRIRSNGRKGQITTVSRAVNGAFTAVILPLATGTAGMLITGTTGTQINALEGIEILGNQLAGESSDTQGTQQSKLYRLDNTATVIRASVKGSDLAHMNKTQITFPTGSNYEPALAIYEMNMQMMASVEDAVLEGVPYSNTSNTGTVGVIPDVVARGTEVDYIYGAFTKGDFNNVTAVLDANGGPREYHGLQALSQRQDINDVLFGLYSAGAIYYGSVGTSSEAAVSYGFKSFSTDTFDFHFHRYKGMNAESKFGYTPTQGDYRQNYGLFAPQGTLSDSKSGQKGYMQWVYQTNPDTAGQPIYSWDLGFTRATKTTEASNTYHQIAYCGSRTVAAEQFLQLKGIVS